MVATFRFGRMIARHRLAVAAFAGALAALAALLLPEWRLVALVEALRLPELVPAARPPLGATARALLAGLAGGGAGLGAWAILGLFTVRPAPSEADAEAEPAMPVIRRADAHPDAPARRPIRAHEDLGDPLPIAGSARAPAAAGAAIVAAPSGPELAVPRDLDTPLAAVDPGAIPDVPRDPVRPVPPLAPAPVEAAAEVFRLMPVRRAAKPAPAPAPIPAPIPTPASASVAEPAVAAASAAEEPGAAMPVRSAANDSSASGAAGSASIAALVDRLERGAAHRRERPRALVDDTLGMLRGLAAR